MTTTIFKSRQVNTDPAPWIDAIGLRNPRKMGFQYEWFEPRPSFNATRDPRPWVYGLLGPATEYFTPAREAEQVTGGFGWDPRPEFDNPVNPILVAFRENRDSRFYDAQHLLEEIQFGLVTDYTPEQIAHAQKVLTRLAYFGQSVVG